MGEEGVDPRMREENGKEKGRFHGGMLAEKGELGQWEDVSGGGSEPGGEIPGGTRNDIWVEGEDHPHPNLPPSRGKGGRGAGSFGNGMMAVGEG